jgi:PAS domain S-box-containing protein
MSVRQPAWLRLLPLVPALVAALLLLSVGLASRQIVGDALESRAGLRVESTAAQYADQVARVLTRSASELGLLGRGTALREGAPAAEMREELDRLVGGAAAFAWVGITDADGRVLAGTRGMLEGASIASRPVFVNGSRGPWFGSLHAPVALAPEYRRLGLQPPAALADLALPLRDAGGQLRGVLVAHLDVAHFDSLRIALLGEEPARRSLTLALLDERGRTLLGELPEGAAVAAAASAAAASAAGDGRFFDDGHGSGVVVAQQAIALSDSALLVPWRVAAAQPLAAALKPVTDLQQRLLVWGTVVALLLGGLGAWASRWLSRPTVALFERLSSKLADRADAAAGRPLDLLAALAAQIDQLPAPAVGDSPGERLLTQVLRDAGRLQSTLLQLPAPVYLLDKDLRVVFWNRASEQVFGFDAAAALGQPVQRLLPGGALGPPELQLQDRIPLEPGPWRFDAQLQRPDGSEVHGEWRLSKVLTGDGAFAGVLAQVLDRSAEHAAERRLREQSETLVAIIHSASDAVIGTDARGRIELFNPAAERIFGHAADAMLGGGLDRLLPESERAGHHGHLADFAASAVTRRRMGTGRVQGRHANGQVLELEASISQARVGGRVVMTAILRDVTERVQAERTLLRMQLELSELTQRLLVQEQAMMRRMAQTLHDRLGQTLTALRLTLDAGARAPSESGRQRAALLTEQAIAEVRQALVDLRPPLLEDQGLAPALANDLRTRETEVPGIDLLLELGPDAERRWPPDVEYAVFMVAREAVANAQRHAEATLVRVLLSGSAGRLALEVVDDGRGLPDGGAASKPGHLGVVGMRERALVIGAEIHFESPPEGGTRVRLNWQETES